MIVNMTKLSKADVLHVAKLAKLNLTEKEVEKFIPQLSNVINQIGELSEADTKDVEATSQTTGLENVSRIDESKPENCLTQEEAVSGSDKIYNGYFKVDAILSERSDK